MTVHSIDGNTWSTKLERIKLLSSQNQDIKFNNLGYVIDIKMLGSVDKNFNVTILKFQRNLEKLRKWLEPYQI